MSQSAFSTSKNRRAFFAESLLPLLPCFDELISDQDWPLFTYKVGLWLKQEGGSSLRGQMLDGTSEDVWQSSSHTAKCFKCSSTRVENL